MANKKSFDGYALIGYLSIVAIIISVFYLGFRVTGFATANDTAVVNVTISTVTAINFTTDFINFGTGSVNTGSPSATLDTDGTSTDGTWAPIRTNFTLENIGNTNVNITLKTGKNASDFIGGDTPVYQFKYANKEATSCVNSTAMSVWMNVSKTDIDLCSYFNAGDINDTINIGVRIVIPSAATGAKTDTFTATATSLP